MVDSFPTSENLDSAAPAPAEDRADLFLERAWEKGALDAVRDRVESLVARTADSDECVLAATFAERLGDAKLYRRALVRAVGLDRRNQAALLALAVLAKSESNPLSMFVLVEEASRASALPERIDAVREELFEAVRGDPRVRPYLRAIGRWPGVAALQPRRILLLTNLFPAGDSGDYGRMIREFALGLLARGHDVRIVTAGVGSEAGRLTDEERALESRVARSLELFGQWKTGGRPTLHAQGQVAARNHRNLKRWRAELSEYRPDFILAGNLDLLGPNLVQAALNNGFPVLHALANAAPGYPTAMQPCSARYWVAPCSDWNGLALRQGGYAPARIETVYPGVRIDRFFRFILPDNSGLRICYSGLVLPGHGAHVLVQALKELRHLGVDFRAEIAGEAPDAEYLEHLRMAVRQGGLGDQVRFSGNLDRDATAALYARSNVLVFPSQCAEPFGISQVEAMASGLVVVTSGTGGAKEIVRHGTDGLQFAPESADDLAEKLRGLSRDGALMTRLQRAAQARATEFSADRACERIEEVMEAMLELSSTESAQGVPLAAFEDAG